MRIYLPQEIANMVSIELNTLAKDMYGDEITTKFVFVGTSDMSVYERYITEEFVLDDDQKITPFIITSIGAAQQAEDFYTRYEENFSITFYPYHNEKSDFETLLREYVNLENTTNRTITKDGNRIEKITGFPVIDNEFLTPQDGSNEYRFSANMRFIWNFAEGVITSDDLTIKFDNIEVPYNVISLGVEKRNINNIPLTLAGIDLYMSSVTDYTLSFNLPYLTAGTAGPKLIDLFQDLWHKKYNKKYKLDITIGTDIVYSEDVYIVGGSFVDPRPTIFDFEFIVKRVPKQAEIYIDNVQIPVISFNLQSKSENDQIVGINNDSVESAYLFSSYSINMTLPLDEEDTNTKTAILLSNTMNRLFGEEHTIRFVRNSLDVSYNVIMVDGNYSIEGESNGTIDLSFTKRDDS